MNAAGRRLEYTLIQSRRANVLFQALPEAGIRVYAPKYLGLRAVDDMVRQRAAELIEMQRAVEARLEAERRAHPVADGSPIMVEGRRMTLRLFRGKRVRDEIAGGEYRLALPDPGDEAAVRAAVKSALSVRAAWIPPARSTLSVSSM